MKKDFTKSHLPLEKKCYFCKCDCLHENTVNDADIKFRRIFQSGDGCGLEL